MRARVLFVAALAVGTVSVARGEGRGVVAGWQWPVATWSPHGLPARDVGDDVAPLLQRCGVADAALAQVAEVLVARKLATGEGPAQEEVEAELRAAGEPHVWPRAWLVSGASLSNGSLLPKLAAWRDAWRTRGVVRCGAARHHGDPEVVAVVAVDALADLDPLPVRAHTGDWLDLSARLDVEAQGAEVLVAAADGPPLRVPSSFDGTHVHARFAASKPGSFAVQVLAHTSEGPRPVLEARVFADVAPPTSADSSLAPGEAAAFAPGASTPTQAFAQMIAALRSDEDLAPLVRDPALDALAAIHTRAMIARGRVAHDLGDGDPDQRARAAGLSPTSLGENVAHASTPQLAHRALWESPSHRSNLLKRSFRRLGLSALVAPDGSVWVTELFAAD